MAKTATETTTKTETPTRFSRYISKLLKASPRSQREIATAVGFKNQNMITMLKLGHVKLALDRVPAMAKALDTDPVAMFKIALTQFYDDAACKLLIALMETGLSKEERKILQVVRDATGSETSELSVEQEKALSEIFTPKE